jgi:putative endonuclease
VRGDVGRTGEEAALSTYRSRGYRLLAKNWRCRLGELDLVLARRDTVVVCEVKARRGSALGGPHEAVTPRKQERLRRLAEAFLADYPRMRAAQVRFDVASVLLLAGERPLVHVYEDAF